MTTALIEKIEESARKAGLTPEAYIDAVQTVARGVMESGAGLVDTTSSNGTCLEREILGDRLRRIGVLGVLEGKKRAYGRTWSEIEGFEFDDAV